MTIPMGTLTRKFLRFFRLSLTQCAPNMFRVLGNIEALNERMNINLTHHDVNWIYNLNNMKGQGYYLKSRYPEIRLIECLPISNKGLKEDFLIFSGEWHDGLPCPVKEGTPGAGSNFQFIRLGLCHSFISPYSLFLSKCTSFCFNSFADSHSTKPLLSLVNRASLDRILRSKVYINEANGQLRAAHLILGYTTISRAFQAPRCVIKARDPQLHHISVAYEGFVVPKGIPIPKGTPFTQPLFRQEYHHPRSFFKKRGKEKKKEKKKVLWT